MKLNRFFGDFSFASARVLINDHEIVHQLISVLRIKQNDSIVLCDGRGNEAIVRIIRLGKREVEAEIMDRMKNVNESSREAILYCAILKRENFELAVQKAVEVGIRRIVPLVTSRTVKLQFKRERVEKIIKEASEQSGRGILPELSEPLSFAEAVKEAGQNGANLFFDLGEAQSISSYQGKLKTVTRVGIFIGPEGGWSLDESKIASENKFSCLSLGPRTLRAETASIVAAYLVTLT